MQVERVEAEAVRSTAEILVGLPVQPDSFYGYLVDVWLYSEYIHGVRHGQEAGVAWTISLRGLSRFHYRGVNRDWDKIRA